MSRSDREGTGLGLRAGSALALPLTCSSGLGTLLQASVPSSGKWGDNRKFSLYYCSPRPCSGALPAVVEQLGISAGGRSCAQLPDLGRAPSSPP